MFLRARVHLLERPLHRPAALTLGTAAVVAHSSQLRPPGAEMMRQQIKLTTPRTSLACIQLHTGGGLLAVNFRPNELLQTCSFLTSALATMCARASRARSTPANLHNNSIVLWWASFTPAAMLPVHAHNDITHLQTGNFSAGGQHGGSASIRRQTHCTAPLPELAPPSSRRAQIGPPLRWPLIALLLCLGRSEKCQWRESIIGRRLELRNAGFIAFMCDFSNGQSASESARLCVVGAHCCCCCGAQSRSGSGSGSRSQTRLAPLLSAPLAGHQMGQIKEGRAAAQKRSPSVWPISSPIIPSGRSISF